MPPTREAFLEAMAAFYKANNGRMGEPTIDKQRVSVGACSEVGRNMPPHMQLTAGLAYEGTTG